MAGRIPREFIDHLLAKVDIVDVIHGRVPLKKHGREYMACCPFHSEKTPSFTVSPNKQFYHCFGCGVHGSAISFLMEYENLDYIEAIELLARSQGLEIPYEQTKGNKASTATTQKAQLDTYALMEQVAKFYQQQLPQAPKAQDYLAQREVSAELIERFQLGYAPEGWDILSKAFPQQTALLIEGGVQIKNDKGRYYDRFRERLMFPIRDRQGRVIGFGGRVLGEGTPKYLNSPETPLFHKGRELYGFYEARQQIRQLERLIVVEGYMDVIALAQFGINYAVATLGTATTSEHIQRLFKTVSEVIFCFDGDRAGKQAAWRALETCLPELRDDREVRFLFLPQGDDPDSLVRKIGTEAFEGLYSSALSLTDYLLEDLKMRFNLGNREGRAQLLDTALGLLGQMPELLLKEQLFNELSKLTGVEVAIIRNSRSLPNTPIPNSYEGAKDQAVKQGIKRTPLRLVIAGLLYEPSLIKHMMNPEQLVRFPLPGIDLLLTLIEIIEEQPHIVTAGLVERLRNTEYEPHLAKALTWLNHPVELAMLEQEFIDSIQQVVRQGMERQLEQLVHRAQTSELTTQEQHDLSSLLAARHRAK
ncbi:DNA primase [Thiofilum flexile]|uniref:DNA primase n=1 Tax=Thiofilum flexile TaxID=125627 RepID=UPI0003812BB8|nr:DNA primase [Thiofilum flexile]